MQITYENKPEDIAAILHGLPWRDRVFGYLQGLQIVQLFWPPALLLVLLQEWLFLEVLLAFMGFLMLAHTYSYIRLWWNISKNAKVVPGKQVLSLGNDFLELRSERGGTRRRWKHIAKIMDLPDFLAIYTHALRAYVVPKRYFSTPEEASQFVERATQLREAAQSQPLPELSWESFSRDFGLQDMELIKYLKWKIDLKICARIETMGVDTDGKRVAPTIWSLCSQLILPGLLAALLFVIQTSSDGIGHPVYYVMLAIDVVFLAVFGIQINTFLRFRKSLAEYRTYIQPDQAWFFQDGLGTVTEEGASFSRWKMLESIGNDREAIVIFDFAPFVYMTIPKATFESPEQEEFIRERMTECHDIENEVHRDVVVADADDVIVADLIDNPFRSPPTK